ATARLSCLATACGRLVRRAARGLHTGAGGRIPAGDAFRLAPRRARLRGYRGSVAGRARHHAFQALSAEVSLCTLPGQTRDGAAFDLFAEWAGQVGVAT